MAINYLSLEKSELELKESFLDMLKSSYKLHLYLYETITSKDKISEEKLEKFLEYNTRISDKKRDIRDDAMWIISKDQPRSSHLRFVIAILYSIKDGERISQYAYNVAKGVSKYPLSISMTEWIPKLLKFSNLFFQKIINVVSKEEIDKYEEDIRNDAKAFRDYYKKFIKTIIRKNMLNSDESIEMYFNFSIIVKYLERTVDHLLEIYKNFLLISS